MTETDLIPAATALIAEDEPLLAAELQAGLGHAWPALRVLALATNGPDAVTQALNLRPDVIFMDIRMPGMTGLEAVEAIAEDWTDEVALPLIVFVTAYEEYALRAFEHAAIDYVLKPVTAERLDRTCERLRASLCLRAGTPDGPQGLSDLLGRLNGLLGSPGVETAFARAAPLRVLQASVGSTIHMVPVDEVLLFEAADKYVRVVTSTREFVIRLPLRQLLPQLDPQCFWQVHRSTVVRVDCIATATRDELGKVELRLRGYPGRVLVSRLYAHRFKAM
jgi:DNA-binding LytR/AlgR family response regulator